MNMHVKPAATLKVGDKIRWRGASGDFFTQGATYEIGGKGQEYFLLTDNEQPRPDDAKHHADTEWILENFNVVRDERKFPVGSRVVRSSLLKDTIGTVTGHINERYNTVAWDDGHGNSWSWKDHELKSATLTIQAGKFYKEPPHTPTTDQWIVCLIEDGQPKPATLPFVHGGAFAANKEAGRLAGVHRGKEFGVYKLVETKRKEPEPPKVYDQEWKRLAKDGRKIAAIKELRTATGLNLKSAKDAVEGWLDFERECPQYV